LAKVTLMPPFAGEFFGGSGEVVVEGANLFRLIEALDVLGPGFADAAEARAGFGVDGAVQADWSAPLEPGAKVIVFARVAGGLT
jgi:molybdopterin converting factor small subunit